MDSRINSLHDLHARYREVFNSARTYAECCTRLNNSQRTLAESFYQLSLRENELKQSLADRGEVLRAFSHNGDALLKSLNYFVSSLETLCGKTIKDMLQTVAVYEQARLEFDVHRHELNALRQTPDAERRVLDEKEAKLAAAKDRYEQLKEDVRVKLSLLEENRLKVMTAQLAHFERGLSGWFAENMRALQQGSPQGTPADELDQQFVRGVAGPSSFLEH